MTPNKFSWRAFISFALFFSFFIILVTGIVLYFAPPGRVAHWVNWKIMGLTKEEWQSVHITFSLTFVLLSLFHLFSVNWRAFLSYIKTKSKSQLNKKRELLISIVLTLVVLGGTLFSVAPFSSVIQYGDYLSATWEDKDQQAPIPHAERLTLIELADQLENINIQQIEESLKHNKLEFNNLNQRVNEVATMNNLSPDELFKIITSKRSSKKAGFGMGRKTIEDIALESNQTIDKILTTLKSHGIIAQKSSTLKELAIKYNKSPRKIYDLIR